MGFFSRDCLGCGDSVKAPFDLPTQLAWQGECVAILPDGSEVSGTYDGYGRVCSRPSDATLVDPQREGETVTLPALAEAGEPDFSFWHQRCWLDVGRPGYSRPSVNSRDQGFFYTRAASAQQSRRK